MSNLVILGDGEGNTRRVGGLLAAITHDSAYPDRMNYELVQKSGDSLFLAGSASLGRQIGPGDVGKFLKAEFVGWGKSGNGRFKEIAVHIWDGEPLPEMKAWPRYAELQRAAARAKAPTAVPPNAPPPENFADFPEALDVEDDDLPF
ncbi:MAG: hypothetical protein ACREL3_08150 [Gemmatimonadales bacterium]